MKKVKARATSALLIALLVVAGIAVYIVRLAEDGGSWATYFTGNTLAGSIVDSEGKTLYSSENGVYWYAEDWATRVACFQLIGDANGNVGTGALRQFRDKMSGYSFINGSSKRETLRLTVNSALNVTAYNALSGRNGTVLVMDYTTGEIICNVSAPSMDPGNPNGDPADGTYINKALSASFVPGSIFKLVTVAAAIENIPDLYSRQFYCAGSVPVGGETVVCTGSHGYQTIEQALANSCNCAFSEISLELGADTLAEYAEKLGLTSPHELDGITTGAGSFDKAEAGSFDLAWSGMGQYHDMVNPYSMLRYVAAIANGGTVIEPTLTGQGFFTQKEKLLSQETADKIAALMSYNVQNTYGTWNFPGLDLCGKTGTAETGDGTSHAWFTGFLDDAEHPYAFIVLVENAGGGLTNAAPVANAVLQAAVAD